MIGLALIFCIVAVLTALIKRGRFFKQVLALSALTVVVFGLTMLATGHRNPQNPYAVIGPAIIGSVIATVMSLIALKLSFIKKSNS